MAVIFGAVACLVFLMLQPVINSRLNPVEEPAEISLTEEVVSAEEEISPEDMIADDQEIQAAAAEEIAANSVDAITQEVLDEVQKQLEEEACDMLRFLRVIEAYFSTLPPVCLLSAYVLIIKRMIETAH